MINISACEFPEFKLYMGKQFGEQQFASGFKVIQAHKDALYSDNGEAKLAELLKPLGFADGETLKNFINYCTTYLIV